MLPIRKKYRKNVYDEKGNRIAYLSYEQATVYERFEFAQAEVQQIVLFKFIKDNIVIDKKYEKNRGKIVMSLMQGDFMEDLIRTKYKTYDSVYRGGGKQAIEQSNIVFVCKELNISPHQLLHEYTMEEFQWYLDGIIYNINEQSEEGRMKNSSIVDKSNGTLQSKQQMFKEVGELLDKHESGNGS